MIFVSGCAMACRVSDALTRTIHHRHRPSDRRMLRDQRRRTVEQKSYLVGYSGDTASAATLQRLLARVSRLDRRVGNVVSFILRYWATNNSKRFGNGEGVLLGRTYVLVGGTHPSNRVCR